jgi:hypothetical protein
LSVGTNRGVNILVEEAELRRQDTASCFGAGVGVAVDPVSLIGGFVNGHPSSLPSHMTALLPSMPAGSMGPFVDYIHPFLFQPALFALQQQATAAHLMETNPVPRFHFNSSVQNQDAIRILQDVYPLAASMSQGPSRDQHGVISSDTIAAYMLASAYSFLSSQSRGISPGQTGSASAELRQSGRGLSEGEEVVTDQVDTISGCTVTTAGPSMPGKDINAAVSEDEVSDFLLFCLHARSKRRQSKLQ